MSLDVDLEDAEKTTQQCICDKCDFVHEHSYYKTLYSANITHNLGEMADACGIYKCLWRPDENGIITAGQLIPLLEKGLHDLISEPLKYAQYNACNGWGKYENFVEFVSKYLETCKEYPDAKVKVCR